MSEFKLNKQEVEEIKNTVKDDEVFATQCIEQDIVKIYLWYRDMEWTGETMGNLDSSWWTWGRSKKQQGRIVATMKTLGAVETLKDLLKHKIPYDSPSIHSQKAKDKSTIDFSKLAKASI